MKEGAVVVSYYELDLVCLRNEHTADHREISVILFPSRDGGILILILQNQIVTVLCIGGIECLIWLNAVCKVVALGGEDTPCEDRNDDEDQKHQEQSENFADGAWNTASCHSGVSFLVFLGRGSEFESVKCVLQNDLRGKRIDHALALGASGVGFVEIAGGGHIR